MLILGKKQGRRWDPEDAFISFVTKYSVRAITPHPAGAGTQARNHPTSASAGWKKVISMNSWILLTEFMGEKMWLIHTKKEKKSHFSTEGENSFEHKHIALFIHDIFSASINLPCSSILINCGGCQGNQSNSIIGCRKVQCIYDYDAGTFLCKN